MTTPNRLLALDVGDARIGVAVSDPLNMFARPLCTIERKKTDPLEKIRELIEEYQVKTLVIGFPYELDGAIGPQAEKVEEFTKELRSYLDKAASVEAKPEVGAADIDIILWDERFTSEEAKEALIGSKLKNKERRAALDRVSAAIILENYMQNQF